MDRLSYATQASGEQHPVYFLQGENGTRYETYEVSTNYYTVRKPQEGANKRKLEKQEERTSQKRS